MIWGASFSLLFVILLFLAIIQYLYLKRSFNRNVPDIKLPSVFCAGETPLLTLEVYTPFIFPGFRCVWNSMLIWQKGKRIIKAVAPINRGNRLEEILFERARRGVYRGSAGCIRLEDLFGFTSFVLYMADPVTLTVIPSTEPDSLVRDQIVAGGKSASDDPKRIRTDELLEVRKYYPGDDARRINWKMFASSGEMFLRIGEETPPPSGEAVVLLNSESSFWHSFNTSSDYLDAAVKDYIILLYYLAETGCRVLAVVGARKEPVLFNPENPDDVLELLADISPADMQLYNPTCEQIYLVSLIAGDYTNRLAETFKGEIKLYLRGLEKPKKSEIARHFLIRENDVLPESLRDIGKIFTLKNSAGDELARLKKISGGRVHGEIV